ncbi:MAG: hypothetical protein CMJ64_07165 [Planctomycetaceae bacterium]|jgi:hypothetical protein|nr:hypothetical protein [Planctomycetaceae bacterium]
MASLKTCRCWAVSRLIGDEPVAEICGDQQFRRRTSLDPFGRRPSPVELDAFLADSAQDKRQRAIDKLVNGGEFVEELFS